jgi:TrmH family RNA methyltransferase
VSRRIRSSNAEYQVLAALRNNRQKRNRENAFVVEGVRNIDAALAHGWNVRDALVPAGGKRSTWAQSVLDRVGSIVEIAPELFGVLTDRNDPPELLLVVEKRARELRDLRVDASFVATVLDRPASPGNIGTIVRSSDALGCSAVIVLGHAADPYDPQAVRASTGSFFAVPVVEVASSDDLVEWANGNSVRLVATDETGTATLDDIASPPLALLFGNEKAGLSRSLRDAADVTVNIPMRGTASSLNVAAAHAVVLFSASARLE